MKIDRLTPILNVSDVPASFHWFEALGWRRAFAWNDGGQIAAAADRNERGDAHFGGIRAGEAEIFLCKGGQGSRGTMQPRFEGDDETDGVWMSWWMHGLDALEKLHTRCVELGYTVTKGPANEPWGIREFHLRHPDGHTFRVSAGIGEE